MYGVFGFWSYDTKFFSFISNVQEIHISPITYERSEWGFSRSLNKDEWRSLAFWLGAESEIVNKELEKVGIEFCNTL